jgi:Ran GTPase-activating protein (RanGAP) involved in mRNA processing and transport
LLEALVKAPRDFDLDLPDNALSSASARVFAETVKESNQSHKYVVDFGNNPMGNDGLKAITEILASGKCKEGSAFMLGNIGINADGLQFLYNTIARYPKGTRLALQRLCDLHGNLLNLDDHPKLFEAIISGPEGLELNLFANMISDVGLKCLADFIPRFPKGVTIILNIHPVAPNPFCSSECIKDLATNVISSGKCPQDVRIILSGIDSRDSDTQKIWKDASQAQERIEAARRQEATVVMQTCCASAPKPGSPLVCERTAMQSQFWQLSSYVVRDIAELVMAPSARDTAPQPAAATDQNPSASCCSCTTPGH